MRAVCQSVAFSAAILACNGSVVNGLKLRAGGSAATGAATVPYEQVQEALTQEEKKADVVETKRTGTAQQVGSKVFALTDACRKRGSYFFGGDVYNEKGEKIRFERELIMKLIGAGLFHKVFKHPNWKSVKHSEKEWREAAEQYAELMIASDAQKAKISELEATVSDLETKKITLEKTQAAALEKQRVELTSSERQRVELTTQLAQKHSEWQVFHTNEMAKKNQEMANIQEFYENKMAEKDRHHQTEIILTERETNESWFEKYSSLDKKYQAIQSEKAALEQKFQDRAGSVENDDDKSPDAMDVFTGADTEAHVVDTPVTKHATPAMTKEESSGGGVFW